MTVITQFTGAITASEAMQCTVILMDVSGSMATDDWRPNRLEAAKEAAREFVEIKRQKYPLHHVAIATFGTEAATQHPLAPAGHSAGSLISAIARIDLDGATNMPAGLKLAHALVTGRSIDLLAQGGAILGRLSKWIFNEPAKPAASTTRPDPRAAKQIVLLTDGHNTASSSPVRVAADIKREGIEIDVIGIGGSPADVAEDELKAIASIGSDGRPRYRFIGDKANLIQEFKNLANRIRRV